MKYLFNLLSRLDPTYKAAYLQLYRACFKEIASCRTLNDPFLLFETLTESRKLFGGEEETVLLLYQRDVTLLLLLSMVASLYAIFLFPCDHTKCP